MNTVGLTVEEVIQQLQTMDKDSVLLIPTSDGYTTVSSVEEGKLDNAKFTFVE